MLRTQPSQPTGSGLDSTPPVSFSGLQVPVSVRPWMDADALERGDGIEAPTMGTNRNSRLRSFINRDVFRAEDTNNLVIVDPKDSTDKLFVGIFPYRVLQSLKRPAKSHQWEQIKKRRETVVYT
ncbi:hypothetical protein K435DRAFT_880433 [Dendrothele bispora CBS 962.96]|nr:hypothetical protein K435DRAFT_880433 [Dendrothele bispora CBS 962.96]